MDFMEDRLLLPEKAGMKTATRFQFWSRAKVARAILLAQVVAVVSVVLVGTFIGLKRNTADRPVNATPAHDTERNGIPGIRSHHNWSERLA